MKCGKWLPRKLALDSLVNKYTALETVIYFLINSYESLFIYLCPKISFSSIFKDMCIVQSALPNHDVYPQNKRDKWAAKKKFLMFSYLILKSIIFHIYLWINCIFRAIYFTSWYFLIREFNFINNIKWTAWIETPFPIIFFANSPRV